MTQKIALAIQYWLAVISGIVLVLSLGLSYFGWGGRIQDGGVKTVQAVVIAG
jgi:hypothetical protein